MNRHSMKHLLKDTSKNSLKVCDIQFYSYFIIFQTQQITELTSKFLLVLLAVGEVVVGATAEASFFITDGM